MKTSRSEFLTVRGLRYHVRHWGVEGAPKLFMVHGWMDVSASFQFVVDALQQDWHVIAPDWRGFGLTQNTPSDTYWFGDYLADLDAIVHHYSADEAINLVGHSLGGNVVSIYAGVRPEKIKRLVNLEGIGLPATKPSQAPARWRNWLNEIPQDMQMKAYDNVAQVANRLQKNNARLSAEKAAFLAEHWALPNAQGKWEILGDPAHKRNGPLLYQLDQVLACWQEVTAPVLWMEGADTDIWRWLGTNDEARAEFDRRLAHFKQLQVEVIADAGHMLHHDQPRKVAGLIEEFLR